MEKILKLFTYVDGRNDTPFPNEQEQVVVSEFRGDYKRMGATPTISCTVMHHKCLDKLWTDNVYATFNGERFFIKQTASSSYDNTDSRYKHEVELVSERIILDNVYFYDVVQSDVTNDKPVSNSSNVVFFGDIHEFANRLNYSLQYSNVGYSVVVDDGISSEGKMMSFQNQFFSNVLQEIYNTYEIPYYFVGKVIHIGYTNNAITHTFKYGVDESLLSIQKQNANYKLVNRVTGVGSADNIPYYYPNDYESKEEVEANGGTWINPQPNLMPSIYRDTLGEERFYKALNNTYVSPQTGEYYYFENPFVEGKPKEHIVNFDEIKPSIKGMLNASNQRIDMFVDFAYDADDNDETDEEGNYLHPYFFAKLRKFDGDYGFNLFDHAIDEQEMVISMTSGSCGACEWIIGVDEASQKNTVQVNSSGNLVRDDKGNIKFGTPQDRQNDTRNYEVWVALKKDINTFGVIMPNASSNYKPSVNDTFVILHIDLPKAYILSAENNLKEQLIKYMAMNNSEKFTFSISFSRIFFAENPQILAQLNENARIQIEYDNTNYELYVSSYSYNMSNGSPLPEIKVELSDTLSVQQNALQNAISEVKQDIMSSVGSGDFLKQGLAYFLRKDTSDRTRGKLSSDVGFEVGRYVSGASGAIIYKDSATGQTVGELDKLYVRMKAYFETLVISEVNTISGKQIISPAGSIKCIGVDEIENAYRCYFLGEQDGSETSNLFHVNDQAYSQTFNAKQGVNNKISNTYYWRLITNVSRDLVVYKNQKCHYIDLSKTDCDNGSDIPKEGDIINHRGSRTDVDRMNFIESSSVDAFSPNITLFHGVNSYSLDGKDYVSYGVDKTTNKAYMNVYGDMFVGDRNGSTYMRYTPDEGLVIKGKLDIETKLGDSTLKDLISASSPEGYQEFVEKVTQDIEGLQQQIDGAIESYFYQYEPTLSNYPASSWNTKELKNAHLNDTFTNLVDGRSWRWTIENGNYKWTEITDTATTQALALAGQAQDTADGKRRVFVAQPKPPYDKGDLWSRGKDYPLLLCVNAKGANGSYDESDWDYADNTEKIQKELEDLVIDTKDELNNAIGQATEAANTYTDNAKSALQTSINELNNAKASVNDVYTKAQADGLISKAEEDAINAAKQQADAAIALSETIVKAYADGVVDAEEAARIKQAQENLNTAKAYAEQKAQEALNDALSSLSTFNYLKAALKEDTSIEGGLIQSSLIKLGYTSSNSFKVMSGSNGIYNSSLKGGGIASWWGGDTYDLLDYYNWDGTQWVKKSGVTVPSNIPSGLIRFDGTGYFAKGKFWWDNNGEIHADPTALLLSFDVATGDETLASTIINIRKDLASFMDMWEVKKLSDGTEYLYSKRHLATNGGVTMYANENDLDIPTIYDGLPIDGTTIYWSDGVLKSKGDGSGSTTKYPLSWSGFNQGSYDGSVAQSFYIPTKLSEFVNDKSFATTSDLSGYLQLSGGNIYGNVEIANKTFNLLTIKRDLTESGASSGIRFKNANGLICTLEAKESSNGLIRGTTKGNFTIWDSGNDGAGSGLDADLLDGHHYTSFFKYNGTWEQSDTSKTADYAHGMVFAYPSHGVPYFWGTLVTFERTSTDGRDYNFQLHGTGKNTLHFRTYSPDYGQKDWKKVAFTDSNVASATKLQTARTIWGQSFDGTGNITGRPYFNTIGKSESSDITINSSSILIGTTADTHSGYNSGIAFNAVSGYASKYLNHIHGWIGLSDCKTASGAELYDLVLATNGSNVLNASPSERMRITYNGNVLIGTTTNPGHKLYVNGSLSTISYLSFRNKSGSEFSYIGRGGEAEMLTIMTYGAENPLNFGTNSKTRMYINGVGNVLIGTTTDSGYKLDVNGNTQIIGNCSIHKSDNYVALELYGINGGCRLYSAYQKDEYMRIDTTDSNGGHVSQVLQIDKNDYVSVQKLNVGAGLNTDNRKAEYRLGVYGTLGVTGVSTFRNDVSIATKLTLAGIPIYKSKDDVLYIDGNLVVRGGVTMYAENEVDIPSIIDSLPIANANTQDKASKGIASFDSAYFKVTDGWVTLTSAPSNGASYLGKLDNVDASIDATASVDRVLYQPAGSAMWVSKPLSEIGGSGGSVSGDYLPLSGGTINGSGDYLYVPLYINALNNQISGITFKTNGTEIGHVGYHYELGMRLHTASTAGIAVSNSDVPIFYTGNGSVKNTILHAGNYSSYALPLTRAIYHTNTGNPDPNTWDGNWMGMTNQSTPDGTNYFHILSSNWANATQNNHKYWSTQLALPTAASNHIFYRKGSSETTFNRWVAVLDDSNVGSYALPISGGTLTGGLTVNGDIAFAYTNKTTWYNEIAINTANYFNSSYAIYGDNGTHWIGDWTMRNMLHWRDGLSASGYVTGYTIGSFRRTSSFGGIFIAVSNSDGLNSVGASMEIEGNGIIGINAPNYVSMSNNLLVAGGITMYSDIRKKTKLQDVELSLSQIANAPLIQHYYNSDQNKTTHVGSIAQYWAELNDWFCKLDNEGYYTMEIQNCALASAISIARHLEKYESKTDKKIRMLKKRITELEDKVERLKKGE